LKEEVVAVKRLKAVPSDNLLRDIKREIEIMKKLSHKNIVEIKGFVEGINETFSFIIK
jgi:serine/threonine protein kinase